MKFKPFGVEIEVPDDVLSAEYQKRMKREQWERKEVKSCDLIPNDARIIELGGCLGVVSTVMNRKLNAPEKMVVVEADPEIIPYLQRTKQLNNCQFQVEHCVVAKEEGVASFTLGGGNVMGGSLVPLQGFKKVNVPAHTFEFLEEKHRTKFDTLIMDIEGSEYELFDEYLFPNGYVKKFKSMMIEFHKRGANESWKKMQQISSQLRDLGYTHQQLQVGLSFFSQI